MKNIAWATALVEQIRLVSVRLFGVVRRWTGRALTRPRAGAALERGRSIRRRYAIGAASREELDTVMRERPSWYRRRRSSVARRPGGKAA